ncbi:hypothetical protein EE612_018602, partial [Oryza sativa]
ALHPHTTHHSILSIFQPLFSRSTLPYISPSSPPHTPDASIAPKVQELLASDASSPYIALWRAKRENNPDKRDSHVLPLALTPTTTAPHCLSPAKTTCNPHKTKKRQQPASLPPPILATSPLKSPLALHLSFSTHTTPAPAPAPASSEEEKEVVATAATGERRHEEATAGREEQEEEEEEEEAPVVLKKGPWTTAEDAVLVQHVRQHGEGNWNAVQRMTGLLRCGKSCRLRWTNHLRPNLKKGSFSPDEELLIAQLHAQLGNKWARMASHLPGRTDNEIKNYWNTRTKRRQRAGLPVYPPDVQLHLAFAKRCRYDDFSSPLSSPQQSAGSNVLSMDAADAAGAASSGYTSARPPPLDLAGQLAMGSRPVQLLAATPFSAPSSPWGKPFARNAQFFQFPHSSPVSPTTPTGPVQVHPVTPELSLGYGLHAGDRARLPPVSPSPGARAELPSSQLRPSMAPTTAAAAATGGLVGGALQDHPNAASLEAMLQELHDAIKIEPPAPPENRGTEEEGGGGGGNLRGVSGE